MLVWYICERMVFFINMTYGIKEPFHGHQNLNTSLKLICGRYVNIRESLYIQVIIRDNTILNHIGTFS